MTKNLIAFISITHFISINMHLLTKYSYLLNLNKKKEKEKCIIPPLNYKTNSLKNIMISMKNYQMLKRIISMINSSL